MYRLLAVLHAKEYPVKRKKLMKPDRPFFESPAAVRQDGPKLESHQEKKSYFHIKREDHVTTEPSGPPTRDDCSYHSVTVSNFLLSSKATDVHRYVQDILDKFLFISTDTLAWK